jgi:hypothetical protein
MRYLLIAQRKLTAAGKRGARAELVGGREVIDEALLMFELIERAAGKEPPEAPAVAAEADGAAPDEDDDPDRPRKRRRRRRGGRRRRRDLLAADGHGG